MQHNSFCCLHNICNFVTWSSRGIGSGRSSVLAVLQLGCTHFWRLLNSWYSMIISISFHMFWNHFYHLQKLNENHKLECTDRQISSSCQWHLILFENVSLIQPRMDLSKFLRLAGGCVRSSLTSSSSTPTRVLQASEIPWAAYFMLLARLAAL